MVFTGTFHRSLDSKLRVLLPKRLRNELHDYTSVYLTPGTDQCLELHTDHSLQELASKADRSSAGLKSVRSFSRLFYARAEQCDIDKQGRIRLPGALAKIAGLEKDIVLIGVGSHWELWNQVRWDSYLEAHHQAFDMIAESTFHPSALPESQQSLVSDTPLGHQADEAHQRKVSPK